MTRMLDEIGVEHDELRGGQVDADLETEALPVAGRAVIEAVDIVREQGPAVVPVTDGLHFRNRFVRGFPVLERRSHFLVPEVVLIDAVERKGVDIEIDLPLLRLLRQGRILVAAGEAKPQQEYRQNTDLCLHGKQI